MIALGLRLNILNRSRKVITGLDEFVRFQDTYENGAFMGVPAIRFSFGILWETSWDNEGSANIGSTVTLNVTNLQ